MMPSNSLLFYIAIIAHRLAYFEELKEIQLHRFLFLYRTKSPLRILAHKLSDFVLMKHAVGYNGFFQLLGNIPHKYWWNGIPDLFV